jgi:tetratricopeptide (TPR) repeat protein
VAGRAEVLAGLGEAALEADRLPDAVSALNEAISAYRAAGDPLASARVAVVLSEVQVLLRDRRRFEMLTETLSLLDSLPPGPEHVAVLTEISGEHHQRKEYETGIEVADRALALAAELGLGRPARTLGYRATNRALRGDPDATDDFREALEIALAAGQIRHASTIYKNFATHRGVFEGPAQALETLNEGIALCRARGLTARVNFKVPGTYNYYFMLGELDELLEVTAGEAERARREGNSEGLARACETHAEVLLLRGQANRIAAMPDELEAGITDATSLAEREIRLSGSAEIRAALGQREAAIALLTRIADEELRTYGFINLLPVAIGLGEITLAERLSGWWNTGHWQVFRDTALAEARGDVEVAIDGYAQLVEHFRSSGDVTWLAKMLVGLGRVLTRLGRTDEAAEALGEARPILVKLQAAPLLAETDALLEQLTALSA